MQNVHGGEPVDAYRVLPDDIGEFRFVTLGVRVVAGSNPAAPTNQKPNEIKPFCPTWLSTRQSKPDVGIFWGLYLKVGLSAVFLPLQGRNGVTPRLHSRPSASRMCTSRRKACNRLLPWRTPSENSLLNVGICPRLATNATSAPWEIPVKR